MKKECSVGNNLTKSVSYVKNYFVGFKITHYFS